MQDWRMYRDAFYDSHDIIPVQLVKEGLLQTKCGFTLDHYFDILDAARKDGYEIEQLCDFHRMMETSKKFIILRHDVDLSLSYALKLAKLEADRELRAIYFVLLQQTCTMQCLKAGPRLCARCLIWGTK